MKTLLPFSCLGKQTEGSNATRYKVRMQEDLNNFRALFGIQIETFTDQIFQLVVNFRILQVNFGSSAESLGNLHG